MKRVLVLLLALAAVSALAELDIHKDLEHHYKNGFSIEVAKAQFKDWVQEHGKVYESAEEFVRREAIFVKRVFEITAHNIKHKAGKVGWTAGISKWADLTIEEFRRLHGYVALNGTRNATPAPRHVKRFASLDWRARGKMGPVKNQDRCGSCWAFATTGATEGCVAISTNSPAPSLSDQQLQDCMFSRKCDPGGGGGADAIDWVVNNGINGDNVYPYTRSDQQCRSIGPKWKAGGRVHGNTEDQLYNMLQTGPVLIGINADPLMNYHGGVIDDAGLSRGRNHAVVVVGVQDNCHNGQACWIIRNSWGPGWAESGHFRVMKGRTVIGLGDDSDMPVKCSSPNGGNGKYGKIEQQDRVGADLPNMPVSANGADDCQLKCYKDANCRAFSFDSCGVPNCWLKSSAPGVTPNNCRLSGIITSSKPGRGQFGDIEQGDRVGNDLPNQPQDAGSAQECQTRCQNNGQCRAFAYDSCGRSCWLKSSAPGRSGDDCRLSGVINR